MPGTLTTLAAMNWLLRRWTILAQLGSEAARPAPTDVDGLSPVPFDVVAELIGLPFPENHPDLQSSFLLWEDSASASERRQHAQEDPREPPSNFTVAVPGRDGVLYLPDERENRERLQLFTDYGGTFARVRAEVLQGSDEKPERPYGYEAVELMNPVENGCPDGPCTWRESCGPGCRCRMYTTQSVYRGRNPGLPKSTYILRCR
jgi:hypothetical protein